uniref:VTT domain-containing protein n=1 Tax=Chrysotila carterae TaxID=13221 RepID=A0A7S4BGL1_CHRCT
MCQQPASSLYNVKDVAKDAPRKTRFTVGGKLLLAAVVTGSVSALAAHVLAQEEGMLKGAQRLHGRVAPLLVDALHHVQRLGGIRGALLLLLMQVGGFLFMVPTSPLSVAAGCAFGLKAGLPIAGGSYLVSCLAPFAISRAWLTETFSVWLRKYPIAETYMAAVEERPFLVTLLLRLSPALPSPVNCYMLGLTSIDSRVYLAATMLGAAPNCAFCVYVGRWRIRSEARAEGCQDGAEAALAAAADGGVERQ